MRAGELRHKVTIQTASGSFDDYGQQDPTFSTGETTWAKVEPVSGRELDSANEQIGEITHKVKIRYRDLARPASGAVLQVYNYDWLEAGDTLTITDGNDDAHNLVADTDWDIVPGNNPTAANLRDAINDVGSGSIFSAFTGFPESFNYRITISQLINGADGNAAPVITGTGWNIMNNWTTLGTDGMTSANRLLFGSQVFQIESVTDWQERGVFLELLCKEVTT